MIKVKTNFDIKKITQAIEKQFKDHFGSKEFKTYVGEFAVDTIYKRTKSGKSLDRAENGKPNPIKPLSESYKKFRKKNEKYLVGEYATPKKSNLTFTGQMLDALKYKLQENKIIVYINSTRRKPTIPGRSEKVGTNNAVAELVSEKRPFLGIATEETRILDNKIRSEAKALLNKIKGGLFK